MVNGIILCVRIGDYSLLICLKGFLDSPDSVQMAEAGPVPFFSLVAYNSMRMSSQRTFRSQRKFLCLSLVLIESHDHLWPNHFACEYMWRNMKWYNWSRLSLMIHPQSQNDLAKESQGCHKTWRMLGTDFLQIYVFMSTMYQISV